MICLNSISLTLLLKHSALRIDRLTDIALKYIIRLFKGPGQFM